MERRGFVKQANPLFRDGYEWVRPFEYEPVDFAAEDADSGPEPTSRITPELAAQIGADVVPGERVRCPYCSAAECSH
jgi:hypothetical protein